MGTARARENISNSFSAIERAVGRPKFSTYGRSVGAEEQLAIEVYEIGGIGRVRTDHDITHFASPAQGAVGSPQFRTMAESVAVK